VLIFLEGASRSPENCLADPSLRTTGLVSYDFTLMAIPVTRRKHTSTQNIHC